MEPVPESAGDESVVEAAEPLLAQLSGLMRLFVLGERSAEAAPAPTRGVLVPVALAVATVHVAVPAGVHVAAAEALPSDDVVAEVVPRELNVIAPVLVHVHVADAVVPLLPQLPFAVEALGVSV